MTIAFQFLRTAAKHLRQHRTEHPSAPGSFQNRIFLLLHFRYPNYILYELIHHQEKMDLEMRMFLFFQKLVLEQPRLGLELEVNNANTSILRRTGKFSGLVYN